MAPRGTKGVWHAVTWPFVKRFAHARHPSKALADAVVSALAQVEMEILGEIGAFVLMPDHLQVVLRPTSIPLNRLLVGLRRRVEATLIRGGRHQKPFAHRYYTRRIETDEELLRVVRQMLRHPVSRDLVAHPGQWPYCSAHAAVAPLFRHLISVPDLMSDQSSKNHIGAGDAGHRAQMELLQGQGKDQQSRSRRKTAKNAAETENKSGRTPRIGTDVQRGKSVVQTPTEANRVAQRDTFGHRALDVLRGWWKRFRRRIVPWDPEWVAVAEEVRFELPGRGRMRRQALAAEEAVARYLWLRGYRVLARNVRCRHGEIDIVVRKGKALVAVEVRSYMEGGERPGDWLSRNKRASVKNALRHFQKLRASILGSLQTETLLAEVQFDKDGHIRSIVLYRIDPLAGMRPLQNRS